MKIEFVNIVLIMVIAIGFLAIAYLMFQIISQIKEQRNAVTEEKNNIEADLDTT